MLNGMENDSITYISINGFPDETMLQKLKQLYVELFTDADTEFFENRLKQKEDVLIIAALNDTKLVGFKIGYFYNAETFYSWVGGVKRNCRRKGIATQLAQIQEFYAKENGYGTLRTKSLNTFKPMMVMNLKNGFDIKSVYTNEMNQTKIVFEKKLLP